MTKSGVLKVIVLHKNYSNFTQKNHHRYNPNNLPFKELKESSRGIKGVPLLKSKMERSSYDALHFLLSMGRLVYGIIIRFNSGISGVWDITQENKNWYC